LLRKNNKSPSNELVVRFDLMVWLTTNQKKTLLLFTIFVVAFLFRIVVIFHSGYPPSTDIGLNSNILNLILDEGKLPLWNPYQMGGEPLTNPPGYHLFASFIVLFTGMPVLAAQMLIAAFFSSFIVFPAYLFSKKIWRSSSAGFLTAFLVGVSSLSLNMLGWGGYANIIALSLISIIFYLFLKNNEHQCHLNFFIAALLFGSLLLTHLLSFFVLFSVLLLYIILLLVGNALKHTRTNSLKIVRFFLISILLGILFVSPWLLRVSSFYLDMASKGVFFGGMAENKTFLLTNRSVDTSILILSGAVVLMFFMFKASRGKYVDSESLLLITWYLVPLFLTQSYIVSIITDYTRFIYFVDFPSLTILSVVMSHLFRYVPVAIKKYAVGKWNRYEKNASKIAFPAILLVIYLISPFAINPMQAVVITNYYTTIKPPEANAMEWIQQRTANSAILVSDNLYGWWLSGVAKRSTLSAVSPQFLLYPNEITVGNSALMLLTTDYYIDNGLIQIREDGGYFVRYNPLFSIETSKGYPRDLFYFNEGEATIYFQQKNIRGTVDLSELKMTEARWVSIDKNSAVLAITRESNLFKIEKTLEVKRGVRFAELSYEIKTIDNQTSIGWINFILHTIEGNLVFNQSMLGLYDPYEKVCGQVIFKENYPEVKKYTTQGMTTIEFLYTNEENSSIKITFLAGVFDAEKMTYQEVLKKYDEFLLNPQQITSNLSVTTWDYLEMIKSYNVSFVVCREQGIYPKFSMDPNFQVAYNNGAVAIFKVVEHK
jgi:hypothetical protein